MHLRINRRKDTTNLSLNIFNILFLSKGAVDSMTFEHEASMHKILN